MTRDPKLLLKKLKLDFDSPELFHAALTHRSAKANNNERLEFLGDSILGFVIASRLYEKFPQASEGELSRLRASLVNQSSLAELARENKIGDYLILGSGELKSGGFRRDSILSDAMEAIMGALYLDKGVEQCSLWILDLFNKKLKSLDLEKGNKDSKTQLQELLQSRKLELPVYELINLAGAAHEQTFNVVCKTVLISEHTTGLGVSRKKAEQAAAEKMLKTIKETIL